MVETVQFLTRCMTEATRLKSLPEMLAASGESRALEIDRDDDREMKELCEAIVETKKRQFSIPVIIR